MNLHRSLLFHLSVQKLNKKGPREILLLGQWDHLCQVSGKQKHLFTKIISHRWIFTFMLQLSIKVCLYVYFSKRNIYIEFLSWGCHCQAAPADMLVMSPIERDKGEKEIGDLGLDFEMRTDRVERESRRGKGCRHWSTAVVERGGEGIVFQRENAY